jgi:hypothetical protein
MAKTRYRNRRHNKESERFNRLGEK